MSVHWIILVISSAVALASVSENINKVISETTTHFSLDLLKTVLSDQRGNVIVPPVSVYLLLTILQQGAHNISKTELDNVLHALPHQTKKGYHNIITSFKNRRGITTLEFTTRLFLRNGFVILPEFKQSLVSDFFSDIESINFTNTTATRKHINSWAAQSTHKRITNLIGPGAISPEEKLLLINGIYFKNFWKNIFSVKNITFSPQPNEEKEIRSIYQEACYYGGVDSEIGAKWVHVKLLSDDKFVVLLVLPTERHGLDSLLNRLTLENLITLFQDNEYNEYKFVKLTLPKFALSTSTDLVPSMKMLGVRNIFGQLADLSGISVQPLYVSGIMLKADITVDEKGIMATAATSVGLRSRDKLWIKDAEELVFTADEPFLIFIVDKENSVPLFAGRVTDPTNTGVQPT